jgi:hypothetical protein
LTIEEDFMNFSLLGRVAALTCSAALIFTISCASPASTTDTNSGGNSGGTAADTSKIGFESGYDLTKVTASDGDVVAGTSMAAAFSLDQTRANTGASSLLVSGTSQNNRYSADYFVEALFPTGTPLATQGKTVSMAVYIPAGSKVYQVSLTLLTDAGVQTMPHGQPVVAGQWNQLSFPITGQTADLDYWDGEYASPVTAPNFDNITQFRLRFQTKDGAAWVSAPVSANVDSVNW